MLPIQNDLPGRFPKRLWCKHKNSVTRKFYWTCFNCGKLIWNVENIIENNIKSITLGLE